MDHNNESSPATTGSQTPTVPAGSGWGQMGGPIGGQMGGGMGGQMGPGMNVPWQQMMGMMAGSQGGLPWGMPGGGQASGGHGGAGAGWGGMPLMQQQMMQMMGMMAGMQGGMQPGMGGSPGGDTVYRPSFDFLTASSHTSTPVETQFGGDDRFSLQELGIDIGEEATPEPASRAAPKKKKKAKGKGKVVGESSQTAVDDAGTRRKWTEDEYVSLARAWLGVCDDPLVANNQRVVNMWAKIRAAYRTICPHGKDYGPEELRKGWDRIRAAVGRFSGLYTNALRMLTSGQNEEDARKEAEAVFPVPGKYKEFTFWECFLVLKESEKFRAGCATGWKKQRLNYSGDYSGSSGGSHDLPPDAEEFPSPRPVVGRPRLVGQKRAQRAARGGFPLSPREVMSSTPLAREYTLLSREKTEERMYKVYQDWRAATDPEEKSLLKGMLVNMQASLDATRAFLGTSDAASDTPGGGAGSDTTGGGGEYGGDGTE